MVRLSAWWSFGRDFGDGGAGGGLVDDALIGGERGQQGLQGEVVDRAWVAAAGLVDQRGGVVGEQGVGSSGQGEVVAQVVGGLFQGHAGHVVAGGDALVEGGEHAEFDLAPQGGLADQQAGQWAVAVEVVVGEHADGFELVVVEQVAFVDDQHGGAAAFGVLGGEGVGGLGGGGGGVGGGGAAEGGDDGVVDAAGAHGGVGQVDQGVAGWVEAGEGGADGDGLADADLAGEHAEGVLVDAPGDAGGGLGMGGVAVQHLGGQVAAERHAGEPVGGLA